MIHHDCCNLRLESHKQYLVLCCWYLEFAYMYQAQEDLLYSLIQEICNSSLGQAAQLITNIDEKCSRVDIEAGAFGISIDLGYALMALGPVTAIVGALNIRR